YSLRPRPRSSVFPALSASLPFFSTDPPPTETYTLSLHDALPISYRSGARPCAGSPRARRPSGRGGGGGGRGPEPPGGVRGRRGSDRKSTRLNSSHVKISYAVFCLKKKNKQLEQPR